MHITFVQFEMSAVSGRSLQSCRLTCKEGFGLKATAWKLVSPAVYVFAKKTRTNHSVRDLLCIRLATAPVLVGSHILPISTHAESFRVV